MVRSVAAASRLRYLGQTDGCGDHGFVDFPDANCAMGVRIGRKFDSTPTAVF
jgi:hypothetical protein